MTDKPFDKKLYEKLNRDSRGRLRGLALRLSGTARVEGFCNEKGIVRDRDILALYKSLQKRNYPGIGKVTIEGIETYLHHKELLTDKSEKPFHEKRQSTNLRADNKILHSLENLLSSIEDIETEQIIKKAKDYLGEDNVPIQMEVWYDPEGNINKIALSKDHLGNRMHPIYLR